MSFSSLIRKNGKKYLLVFLLILSIFSTGLYLTAGQKNWDKSLVLLSEQFLHRKISLPINDDLPIADVSDFHNTFYLYFGPFPSILLMPGVAVFGKHFPQYYLGIFAMLTSFLAVYSLSQKFKFNKQDSLWLALFFVFSTVLFAASVMNISAFQVEVVGVPFLLFALNEYFGKKRGLIIGLFLAIATLTRFTLVFAVLFFLIEFLRKRLTRRTIALVLLPVICAVILTGLYNQRRFHSYFDFGYQYTRNLNSYPLVENLKHGSMSISHIPAHLYSFLIMAPQPLFAQPHGFFLKYPYLEASPWGLSIWYTSPLFLLLLFKFKKHMRQGD